MDMVDLMLRKIKEWDEDPSTAPRVALLSGTGERAFSAGADVVSFYHSGTGRADPKIKEDFFAKKYLLDYALA